MNLVFAVGQAASFLIWLAVIDEGEWLSFDATKEKSFLVAVNDEGRRINKLGFANANLSLEEAVKRVVSAISETDSCG